ncbi:hypothetical protein EBR57_02020 [bacterium]|nr:hypothetical protein [bacterium]
MASDISTSSPSSGTISEKQNYRNDGTIESTKYYKMTRLADRSSREFFDYKSKGQAKFAKRVVDKDGSGDITMQYESYMESPDGIKASKLSMRNKAGGYDVFLELRSKPDGTSTFKSRYRSEEL